MRLFKGIAAVMAALTGSIAPAHAELAVDIVYLRQEVARPPVLSNLDPIPGDLGVAGAEIGLADNLTTGSFMGHAYTLDIVEVPIDGDLAGAARAALGQTGLLVLDMPASDALMVADLPEAAGALLLDATATDSALRQEDCRANMLHTMPSRAMLSDALMQFAVKRRWDRLSLIEGVHDGDKAFAEALRQSAKKFGLRIKGEKIWAFDADMRRNAAQEVPLFTQDLPDHDMLLIADELGDFGRYIAYNTWEPRPVAGSEGLKPVAWSPVAEQWGAAQLQSRFMDSAARQMRPEDYGAWAAVRVIGEAVTRTNAADPASLRAYLLSEDFELAAFKGRPLSFRPWNGQLRQPIPLVTDRAVAANAPLEGFLHPVSELDTLGVDEAETTCTAFQE